MHSAQLLLCMAGETVARGKKKEDGTERVAPTAAAASFLAHLCYPRAYVHIYVSAGVLQEQ